MSDFSPKEYGKIAVLNIDLSKNTKEAETQTTRRTMLSII
jgi:hypothetical protein